MRNPPIIEKIRNLPFDFEETSKDIERILENEFSDLKCPECGCEDLCVYGYGDVEYRSQRERMIYNVILICNKCNTKFKFKG